MTKTAAIQACYADYRRVKGRKVLQLIFEVPLEQAPQVHDVFGEPMPDGSTWVGIARIDPNAKAEPVKAEKPPRKWGELSRAEQAGIACNERGFRSWLYEYFQLGYAVDVDGAAELVREHCRVRSRADLDTNSKAAKAWDELYSGYIVWLRAPEVVG
jgi:hypothetical protein